MIQRIQTIYLVIGACSIGSIYLLDELWTGPAAMRSSWFTAVTVGIFGLCLIVALVAIFLFKNRKRQRSIVVLLQILTILGVVALFVGAYLGGTLPGIGSESDGRVEGIALGLGALGYVLFYLARRGIEKDITLIRSADRLR